MGSIINQTALDASNTAFETAAQQVFGGGVPGVYERFTTVRPQRGTAAQLDLTDGVPVIREWFGPKVFEQLRKYTLQKAIRKWEASLVVDVDEINGDLTGTVADRLRNFVSMNARAYDKIFCAELVANPTGFDSVALLASTHPTTGGGTQSNLTTSALTYTTFRAGRQAMKEFTDFKGEYLDMSPTTLLVGTAQEEIALQVTGSDKLVGISDAGEIVASGGSGVDFGGVIRNYIGGEVAVAVTPRFTGNEWFLIDESKGIAKPLYGAEFQAPETTIKDRPDDDNVFFDDQVLYSLTAKITPMAMCWQTIYGSVTA